MPRDSGYIPKCGDIIFFDWKDKETGEQDGLADHTGIVEYTDLQTMKVHTIEGNTSDSVAERVYDATCVNHIHRDTETNDIEKTISSLTKSSETIRAYDGHSTLVNYALVAAEGLQRVFTRRGANIWDIIQSAYVVKKIGGCVYYPDGREIFPIRIDDLKMEGSKLIMGFNIASSESAKKTILQNIKVKENDER